MYITMQMLSFLQISCWLYRMRISRRSICLGSVTLEMGIIRRFIRFLSIIRRLITIFPFSCLLLELYSWINNMINVFQRLNCSLNILTATGKWKVVKLSSVLSATKLRKINSKLFSFTLNVSWKMRPMLRLSIDWLIANWSLEAKSWSF